MQIKLTVVETGPKGKHVTTHTETLSEVVTLRQAVDFCDAKLRKYVPEIAEQATLVEESPKERRRRERS